MQFAWNWLDEKENDDCHGVIAIRRECFVTFLNQVLSQALKSVCFAPSVQVWVDGMSTYYVWSLPEYTGALAYTPVSNGGSHVLTFTHKGGPVRDNAGVNGLIGWMEVSADSTSDVYLEGNLIKVITTVKSRAEATYLSSDSFNKQWIDIKVERWFQISVDANGALVATLSKSSPQTVDNSEAIDLTGWGKSVAVDINGWRTSLSNTQNQAKAHLSDYGGKLKDMLNNTGAWVFPGGKTFLYTDVYLSEQLDLVTHITYADPV
ncbi:hypothetical protein D3C80_605770 [compost metagenome]